VSLKRAKRGVIVILCTVTSAHVGLLGYKQNLLLLFYLLTKMRDFGSPLLDLKLKFVYTNVKIVM